MQIAYISNSWLPSREANSIHVMKMCAALASNGHEVTLFARRNEKDRIDQSLYTYYGVPDTFEIRRIPWLRIRGRSYIYGYMAALASKRKSVDLVYGRFLPGCYLASLLGIPVVLESHFPIGDLGKLNASIVRRLTQRRNFLGLVVITKPLADYYATEFDTPPSKLVVAPDGADPTSNNLVLAKPKNPERLQIGYVGHLYRGRGIEIIIELARRCQWGDFHIVGGNQEDIDYWTDVAGDLANLYIHGFASPGQTEKYRAMFDVALAPYQNDVSSIGARGPRRTGSWMSPLKIFEYMASGNAIICSDFPVLREVLKQDENALLCSPDDLQGWHDALLRLNQDRNLRETIAAKALNDFNENYSWKTRAKTILQKLDLA